MNCFLQLHIKTGLKLISLLGLLLLSIPSTFAQTNVDSLERLLVTTKYDSVKIDALQDLSIYYRTIDTSLSASFARQILDIGKTNNNRSAYINAYNLLGNLAQNAGSYEKAISYYKAAMPYASDSANVARLYGGIASVKYYINQIDSAEYYMYKGYEIKLRHDTDDTISLATSIFNMAMLAEMRNDYRQALTYYHEAEDMFESWGNDAQRAVFYNNIGIAHSELGEDEQRIKYLTKAYQLAKIIPDLRTIGTSATNLANYEEQQGNITTAIAYHQEAIEALRTIGQTHDLSNSLQTLGNLYLADMKYGKAKHLLLEAYPLAQKASNQGAHVFALNGLAQIAIYENNKSEAEDYHNALAILVSDVSKFETQTVIYKQLVAYSEFTDNYADAFTFQKKYQVAQDSLDSGRQNKAVKELLIKYQTQEKEALLAQQQLQIQQRTSQRNLAYAGGLGILLLGGFLFYRNRQKQLLSASKIENLEKQQQLIALDYMVQGQEEERKRIAQDLHDGLGGLLSSARMQMQVIHREMEKFSEMDLFAKAETMIDTACTEVRRIAHDMMPGALIDLGLIDAIEDLLSKMSKKNSLQFEFTHHDDITISDLQSIQLYRITQEITNNTVKHANAKKISCELRDDDSNITLILSDDGDGFEMTSALRQDGIGLQNIQSRVRYLNGVLDFSSTPQRGTTYHITIPK